MPACDQYIYDFYRIPDGSRVDIWTEGDQPAYETRCKVLGDAEPYVISSEDMHRDDPVADPPESFTVHSPQRYSATFLTEFLAQTDVILNLRIVVDPGTPNEAVRDKRIHCTVSGGPDDLDDHRIAFLVTNQGQG